MQQAERSNEPPVSCTRCGMEWDATATPLCPRCLRAQWLATPLLIRSKHDPDALGGKIETYRSVLTPRVVADLGAVLEFAACHGAWFLDTFYEMFVHVTREPLGRNAGVGIPAGQREPEHALDCLFVAEADSAETAHLFAVDGARHAAQVRAGVFVPLPRCASCGNLSRPGLGHCTQHSREKSRDSRERKSGGR